MSAPRICGMHMPDAYASGSCATEMHERTYELTHADTSKTESRSRVSNAHERTTLHRWIETPDGLTKCPRCEQKARTA